MDLLFQHVFWQYMIISKLVKCCSSSIIVTYIKKNIITILQKIYSLPRNLRASNKLPVLFLKKPLCTSNLWPMHKIFIERPGKHWVLCLFEICENWNTPVEQCGFTAIVAQQLHSFRILKLHFLSYVTSQTILYINRNCQGL